MDLSVLNSHKLWKVKDIEEFATSCAEEADTMEFDFYEFFQQQ
jgi:hypothetical protein